MSKTKERNSLYDPFRSNPGVTRTALIERMYIRILTEWATTRFKWIGLPDTIDPRFLEQELFYKSMILFYYDDDFGRYLAVRGTAVGPINMYDNPTKFRTIGVSGYRGVDLTPDNCVPIWGSYSRIPARDIVLVYARRLAQLDVSLEANTRALRNNRVVTCDESERLTYTNLLRQADEGVPTIFGTRSLNLDNLQVLDLSVKPENLDSLRLEKNQVWNETMTLLGITNGNQDKKERLVAAEATASSGQVLAARNSAMKPRQEACDQINRIYGLDISVEWDLEEDITAGVGELPDGRENDDTENEDDE